VIDGIGNEETPCNQIFLALPVMAMVVVKIRLLTSAKIDIGEYLPKRCKARRNAL
tara:strand:+ start:587 stop:751 length:165 start_codon:yes stop_codon:yes gene_type:complete